MKKWSRGAGALLASALLASALLAGAGIFATGVLSGCASKNKDGKSDKSATGEISDKGAVGDSSEKGAAGGLSYKSAFDDFAEEEIITMANTKAEKLGVPKEKLHGQYKFFLEYMDQVEKNPKLGDFNELLIMLFPDVAEHIKDENKTFFLEQLSRLQFEIGDIEFGGQYYSETDLITISSKYYQWEELDNCFIFLHETYHFLDRYIDGLEQSALYDGQNFTYIDEDFTYHGNDEPVRCYFAEEGLADLAVAKSLSNFFDSYHAACNFLTAMEYIYGEDVVADMLYDRNTTGKFIEILQDLGYDNAKIVQVIHDFNAYTYDFWDMLGSLVYSFEDVLVDMYEKRIGPDWAKDPQFCFLLYNQTRAYTEAQPFTGKYLHREIEELAKAEARRMQDRCAAINRKYDVFQQDEDPENCHSVFYQNGQLWLSELVWATDANNEDVLKLQMLRYDFGSETIVEQKMIDPIEFPEKLHKDYVAKHKTEAE